MKKFLAFLITAVLFIGIFWQDRTQILDEFDEGIAILIEYFQKDLVSHDVFEDLNSGKYFVNNTFLFAKFAKDLGYYKISFPKRDDTLLILRRGVKKIVVKNDETIILSIYKDDFEKGICVKKFHGQEGEYLFDYGGVVGKEKVNEERIFEIASALIHLRNSDTLMDMASKNRAESEKLFKNPGLLKASFEEAFFILNYMLKLLK